MINLKQFGYRATGIMIGLSAAGLAYHFLGVVGVALSNADTIRELHVGWFPLRAFAAINAARFSVGCVFSVSQKITLPRKGRVRLG